MEKGNQHDFPELRTLKLDLKYRKEIKGDRVWSGVGESGCPGKDGSK